MPERDVFHADQRVAAQQARHAAEPLDPISRDILLHISAKSDLGERLRLSDIRFNPHFGSPATALGRLHGLIESGWVTTSPDPDDGRAQIISLTTNSVRRLNVISQQLKKIIQDQ